MNNHPIPIRIEVDAETSQFGAPFSTYTPGNTTTYYQLDESRRDLIRDIIHVWKKVGSDVHFGHLIHEIFEISQREEYSNIEQEILNKARDWYLKNKKYEFISLKGIVSNLK